MKKKRPESLVQRPEGFFRRGDRGILYVTLSFIKMHLGYFVLMGAVLLIHLALLSTPFLNRFENVFSDAFFRHRPNLEIHPDIAYIEIEEEGIQALGRWPWPRHYHAVLTHVLKEWGARAIVFDIIFSEPGDPFDDEAFQESIRQTDNTYLPTILEKKDDLAFWMHSIERFEENATGTGHINIVPDEDGTLRRIKPFLIEKGEQHPHLALRVAYDFLGKPLPDSTDLLDLPLDKKGNLIIPWAGRWRETFHHFSYLDVITSFEALQSGQKPLVSPEQFKDKICLIGLTSTGHTDIKATPMEAVYPALGVHANVLNGLLLNQFIRNASFLKNAVLMLLLGFLCFFFFVPFRNTFSLLGAAGLSVAWLGLSFFVFSKYGVLIAVVHPLLMIFFSFIFSAVYSHIGMKREQKRLFSLATRDGLTGLYVIRHFREILNQMTIKALSQRFALSVILIDVDDFKNINDTYGHQAGDYVLKQTAQLMQAHVRQKRSIDDVDFIARYGGEEFIIMVRKAKLEAVCFNVAERLREEVQKADFVWEGKKIKVTISLGIGTLWKGESVPDLMVKRADEALYRAKGAGKNRVCVEKSPMENKPA